LKNAGRNSLYCRIIRVVLRRGCVYASLNAFKNQPLNNVSDRAGDKNRCPKGPDGRLVFTGLPAAFWSGIERHNYAAGVLK